VRIADIAVVRLGALTRYGAVTRNGEGEAVEGLVLGLRGANAREVVARVKDKLKELESSLPEGVKTNVFYDRSQLVNTAVHTVTQSLKEAIILVLVLLMLFLGNVRAALTVALILPLAALGTFVLMNHFGMSANLMSLGGLAIAIGMLVDAAVVVVENIITHLAHAGPNAKLPRLHLIYRAVREVSTPVTSGIIIIIIVFLPLLTLEGLEGKLFIPVALTIVFALGSSLLLSLTIIPVLSSYLLTKVSHEDAWLVRVLTRAYVPSLQWSLRNPGKIAVVAGLALSATVFGYTQIGKAFMPSRDEGDLILQLEKLPSINLQQSVDMDLRVQRALMEKVPEVTGVVARVGSDELGLDPMGLNDTDSFLVLKPRDQWRMDNKEALMDEIRKVMEDIPGISYGFNQPIEMRVSEMLVGVRGDLAVKIYGPDLSELNRLADEIRVALEKVPGAEDVRASQNDGVQYLRVKIDRLAAGRLNLTVDELEAILRSYVEGKRIGNVNEGARRIPLILRGDNSLRADPEQFANIRITLPDVRNIPLSTIAKLDRVEGPVKVDRERGERMTVVASNVRGRDLVGFVDDAKVYIAQNVKLPTGYRLEWGGQFENQQRAAQRLAIVVPVSLVLIFLLLFTTFGSVRQSLLVLGNIPFAMIGGVFALWISGEYLSVPASVGFIALLGIAVLNGVVLVTYFNQLYEHGMALEQLVVEGAKRRLRPVLMTAAIAAFGLVPLLFASGPGSEIQKPLAVVVIGGLVTSTLLTLIVLPIMYRRFGVANGRV
ncbi:MAG: CusA/CzcA family heavy metal efflux RND transporter, partial [Gammaproteobacteria bacterium]|nr:CusA/CzcA family heavy metal efflux RND transporter [Gammaproteobacteria bacterium]